MADVNFDHSKLLTFVPNVSKILRAHIGNQSESPVGYQFTLVTDDDIPFSGGTAESKDEALRICIAEAIERAVFFRLTKDEHWRKTFLIDRFPTSCGFAAGFEAGSTRFRSICEAVERWAWEQWIDHGFQVPRVPAADVTLSPLAKHIASEFDEIRFYSIDLPMMSIEDNQLSLRFSVAIGLKGNGVFPGSRVSTSKDDGWTHAALEAGRNLRAFDQQTQSGVIDNFLESRISYFGNNGADALETIERANKSYWQAPKLLFSQVAHRSDSEFVFRSLCEGFQGWHLGDEKRFVY